MVRGQGTERPFESFVHGRIWRCGLGNGLGGAQRPQYPEEQREEYEGRLPDVDMQGMKPARLVDTRVVQRDDADEDHKQGVRVKLARCHEQLADLSGALAQLWDDLAAGSKRLKLYRQMKMYNDPTLNPYLYSDKTA